MSLYKFIMYVVSAVASAAALYCAFDAIRFGWVFAILSFVVLFNAIGKTRKATERGLCAFLFLIVFIALQYSFLLHVSIVHERFAFLLIIVVLTVYLIPMICWIFLSFSYSVESFACVFLISEYVFAKSGIGNQMFQLGVTFVDCKLFDEIYALGGPWWLSAIGMLLAYLFYKLLHEFRLDEIVPLVVIIAFALVFKTDSSKSEKTKSIDVCAFSVANVSYIDSLLLELNSAFIKADYVILPEAMVSMHKHGVATDPFMTKLYRMSESLQSSFVSGAYTYCNGAERNNAVFVSDSAIVFCRNKKILIPFAEYVPYSKFVGNNDFIMSHLPPPLTRGIGVDCFDDGTASFAPLICFEALFSNYITHLCRNGAEVFFVSSSNLLIDSRHIERISQKIILMNSLMARRGFVRSSENGISSIISDDGIVEAEASGVKEIISSNVYLNDELTFYVAHDVIIDYMYYLLMLLMLFLIAWKV